MKQSQTNNSAQLLNSPIEELRAFYKAPHIELIVLDNEISLALQSAPPAGPNELGYHNIDSQTNPFHNKA